jgi:hypothetical protein
MTPSGVVRETGTIAFKSFATERRERLATKQNMIAAAR